MTSVLVVEDNFIIALEAEDILATLGVDEVVIATSLKQARELMDQRAFDAVLLDVNLGPGTSFDFARHLVERGVPFGFASGYGDGEDFPPELRAVPRISKPFNETTLGDLLSRTIGLPG
ncbi:response regulator [Ensifer soli]|uniref:response regulator n=1 Tax=Ciceribacter sp. sgz301302 TaxID=3342379 RepID=UPI0035B73B99